VHLVGSYYTDKLVSNPPIQSRFILIKTHGRSFTCYSLLLRNTNVMRRSCVGIRP